MSLWRCHSVIQSLGFSVRVQTVLQVWIYGFNRLTLIRLGLCQTNFWPRGHFTHSVREKRKKTTARADLLCTVCYRSRRFLIGDANVSLYLIYHQVCNVFSRFHFYASAKREYFLEFFIKTIKLLIFSTADTKTQSKCSANFLTQTIK